MNSTERIELDKDNMTLTQLLDDALDRGDEKEFRRLSGLLTGMTELYEREELE